MELTKDLTKKMVEFAFIAMENYGEEQEPKIHKKHHRKTSIYG